MYVAATPRKKDRFGPHIGEVIVRGVPRRPAGDPGNGALIGARSSPLGHVAGLLHVIGLGQFFGGTLS